MDLGLMCLILCGHKRKPPVKEMRMMMVLFANCVHKVIYLSVALDT